MFGLIPMRIYENFEFYRFFSAILITGTAWQALLEAVLLFAIAEMLLERI